MKERMDRVNFKGPLDVPRASLEGFTAGKIALMQENIGRPGSRERIIFNLISKRPLRISELANFTRGGCEP